MSYSIEDSFEIKIEHNRVQLCRPTIINNQYNFGNFPLFSIVMDIAFHVNVFGQFAQQNQRQRQRRAVFNRKIYLSSVNGTASSFHAQHITKQFKLPKKREVSFNRFGGVFCIIIHNDFIIVIFTYLFIYCELNF